MVTARRWQRRVHTWPPIVRFTAPPHCARRFTTDVIIPSVSASSDNWPASRAVVVLFPRYYTHLHLPHAANLSRPVGDVRGTTFDAGYMTLWASLNLSGSKFNYTKLTALFHHKYGMVVEQEVKVFDKKRLTGAHSPVRGPPAGRNLYHWIPGVGFPISVP